MATYLNTYRFFNNIPEHITKPIARLELLGWKEQCPSLDHWEWRKGTGFNVSILKYYWDENKWYHHYPRKEYDVGLYLVKIDQEE